MFVTEFNFSLITYKLIFIHFILIVNTFSTHI